MRRAWVLWVWIACLAGCDDDAKRSAPSGEDTAQRDTRVAVDGLADTGTGSDVDADDVDGDVTLTPPEFGASGVSEAWLAGDFHVHATGASNDTGGDSTPARIKEVAIERGLDFVVLTDHSNSTGSDPTTTDEDPALFNQGPEFPLWDEAALLSDGDFLMIDGNEMSPREEGEGPSGHVGCYPRDLTTFDPEVAFVDRPRGEVNGAQTLQQARDAGCFATVNHPFGLATWVAFDWSSRDYDGMEVYNGSAGWDIFDLRAVSAVACDWSQGTRTTAIGGSDNHRVNIEPPGSITNPPLGMPTTYVRAGSLAWPEIVAGLDAGTVVISDTGAPLELDVHAADGAWLASVGGEAEAGAAAWGRLRGALLESSSQRKTLRLYRVAAGACEDTRAEGALDAPTPNWTLIGEQSIERGETFDVAFPLSLEPGDVVFAWLSSGLQQPLQESGVAITNPVWLR